MDKWYIFTCQTSSVYNSDSSLSWWERCLVLHHWELLHICKLAVRPTLTGLSEVVNMNRNMIAVCSGLKNEKGVIDSALYIHACKWNWSRSLCNFSHIYWSHFKYGTNVTYDWKICHVFKISQNSEILNWFDVLSMWWECFKLIPHLSFYYYPRPVLAFGYCRCLRLSVCVSVCASITCLSAR